LRIKKLSVTALVFSFFMGTFSPVFAFDHKPYDKLLKKYVNEKGGVDYKAFRKNKEDYQSLKTYNQTIFKTDTDQISDMEKKNLYINAYNSFTLQLILDHYPITSIKKIPKVSGITGFGQWKKELWKINNKKISLDAIEHQILRPMGDPRIHFAINCASISCPNLLNEVFMPRTLDEQLDQVARVFNQSSKGVQVIQKGDRVTLRLSIIYKWFEKDFLVGATDIPTYVAQYASGKNKKLILANKEKLKIKYMEYNWNLNDHLALTAQR